MVSLGIKTVVSSGTPVQINAAGAPCNAVTFQAIKSVGPATANTGSIYIGLAGMSKATGAGVLFVLAVGQSATSTQPKSVIPLLDNIGNYWIDADNSGDGCLVSYS